MKFARFLLALTALLPACAQPAEDRRVAPHAGSATFMNDPAEPELALLEHLLEEYFRNAGERAVTICAAATRGDRIPLAEESELALMKRFPALAPFERCQWKNGRYVDSLTGGDARVYHVSRLECDDARRCTALGGFIAANLGAEYSEYRMFFEDGTWRIERGELTIMA